MTSDNELRDKIIETHNDVKHLVKNFDQHIDEDEQKHRDNILKFDAINKTLGFQQKIIYGALGIVAFLEFISKFVR